jgi:hypothetical protein
MAMVVAATNDPLRTPCSDNTDHLECDLLITNAFTAPGTLSSVQGPAPGASACCASRAMTSSRRPSRSSTGR